jgi:ATP phosphoribosyltransferase regulatory subunit
VFWVKRSPALWAPVLTDPNPLRAILDRLGARWVAPPVLQPANLYLELAGEDIRRRAFMVAVDDGEELCLRPDMTVPACRMALRAGLTPSILAYEGLVFRRQTPGGPKDLAGETEFTQVGGEWCGLSDDPVQVDAAVIAAALEGAAAYGVRPVVRLGDVGLFLAIADGLGWPAHWLSRLKRGFRQPGGVKRVLEAATAAQEAAPAAFPAGLSAQAAEARLAGALAEQGVMLVGARSLAEIAARLTQKAQDAAAERPSPAAIAGVQAALALEQPFGEADDAIGALLADAPHPARAAGARAAAKARWAAAAVLPANSRFSPGFGRGFSYYDGLVFELEAPGLGARASLGGGGRYNGLLADLAAANGGPAPRCALTAAGFALRPQRLLEAAGR